jgi:hypothetical protein
VEFFGSNDLAKGSADINDSLKALMVRHLPPIVIFQWTIKSTVTSDHGMTVFFLTGTSPGPKPGSL